MNNLYKILGVKSNATMEAIKKAYRKKVLQHHPDRSGDPEKFREVQAAFDCLSDPDKRAHYDRTGEIPPLSTEGHGPAVDTLVDGFNRTMTFLFQQGRDPAKTDVLGLMKNTLRDAIRRIDDDIQKIRDSVRRWEGLAGRFTSSESDNFLESSVQQQISLGRKQESDLEATKKRHEDAMALLAKYQFKMDHSAAQPREAYLIGVGWASLP